MRIGEDELACLRTVGDAEADRDLVEIWPQLSDCEQKLLLKALGRYDPAQPPDAEYPLPAAVQRYVERPFAALSDEDARHLAQAQTAYTTRHRLGARVVLGAYSLPIVYIEPEISLTLAGTGQLLRHARRRLEDTQAFVDAVMKPDNLLPGAPGQRWIRKVRLTHAVIRMMGRSRGDARVASSDAAAPLENLDNLWYLPQVAAEVQLRMRGAKDTMPLDQVEMALVLQTFAWVIPDGLRKMGWPMSAQETEDHVRGWSAIGEMLGIGKKLLPGGSMAVKDAEALFVQLRDDLLKAGDPLGPDHSGEGERRLSGRLLVAALITNLMQIQREATPPRLHRWLKILPRVDEALQQMPRVLVRKLCGGPAARYLRIGRPAWFDLAVCWLALKFYDLREVAEHGTAPPADGEPVLSGALL